MGQSEPQLMGNAKFMRRHAIGVAVAALVLLGLIGALIQLRHAQRQRILARAQSDKTLIAPDDRKAALSQRQKALQVRERIVLQDPKNQQALFDLAVAHGELAESYEDLRDPAEALDHGRESADLFKELLGSDRKNATYERNLGLAYERLGGALILAAKGEAESRDRRLDILHQARRAYAESLRIFTALRDRGALIPSDAHQMEKLTGKIADTDKEIANLSR